MNTEEKIYQKLLQVPTGYVTTYGDLAKAINLNSWLSGHTEETLCGMSAKKEVYSSRPRDEWCTLQKKQFLVNSASDYCYWILLSHASQLG